MQTEAVVSIFLSTLSDSEQAVYEAMAGITHNGEPVEQAYGNKLNLDGGEYAIVVSDRQLTSEEARAFYDDIMEYHHAKDELPEEEIAVRDEEVKTKWLNGNFNWWAIGAGKLEPTIEHSAKCGTCCGACGCKE